MWIHVLSLLSGTQSYEFISILLFDRSDPKLIAFFQKLYWLTTWILAERNYSKWWCWCFSVFQYLTTLSHIERKRQWDRVREWDSMTDRGRARRVNLAVTAFSLLWMTFFFPLSILWDFKASISAEWFGPTIVWLLNIHQGLSFSWGLRLCIGSAGISRYITIIYIFIMYTTVDIDIVWFLVWTWVFGFWWIISSKFHAVD